MTHPAPGHVVVALDSFKGSLSARLATAAVARGLRRHGATVHEHPVADGGEGTLDAVLTAGFTAVPVASVDALGRPVLARYAVRDGVAVVELAETSGLGRVADVPVMPERAAAASTFGTGLVIAAALDAGCTAVVVGLGGSATTDGGAGLLAGLGARLLDGDGNVVEAMTSPPAVRAVDRTGLLDGDAAATPPQPAIREIDQDGLLDGAPAGISPLRAVRDTDRAGALDGDAAPTSPLRAVRAVDRSGLHPRLAEVELVVATDVDNPLTGPHGAAAVYGPQKGADSALVAALDADLARWADLLDAGAATVPGAGAAGGAGFALLALGASVRPGIDLVLGLTGLADRLPGARLVVTGEGRLDRQTLRGKAPVGVAAAARRVGVTAVAATGSCALDRAELAAAGFAGAFALTDLEPDVSVCLTRAEPLLERLGERIATTFPAT
ncbi:glycerate kinase [Actinosynnema sp. NPDC059335]|uniref:glycerate kinase n=1 Tax=Actinosynnema sp. NPDC059335 TaxID=3346804 RepID=UPI00366FEF09